MILLGFWSLPWAKVLRLIFYLFFLCCCHLLALSWNSVDFSSISHFVGDVVSSVIYGFLGIKRSLLEGESKGC